MKTHRHLVIFTRYPQLGTGKRRLAAQTGAVEALRFQRVNLEHTLLRLGRDARWTTWLAITPDRSAPWPQCVNLIPQGKGDLGVRLLHVAKTLPRGPVLVIGSDVPGIPPQLIARGFQLLDGHDAVLGPSSDGGYWAVGLRRRPTIIDPFKSVRWSTSYALADTLRNLGEKSVALLDELDDVDDANALRRKEGWNLLNKRSLGGKNIVT